MQTDPYVRLYFLASEPGRAQPQGRTFHVCLGRLLTGVVLMPGPGNSRRVAAIRAGRSSPSTRLECQLGSAGGSGTSGSGSSGTGATCDEARAALPAPASPPAPAVDGTLLAAGRRPAPAPAPSALAPTRRHQRRPRRAPTACSPQRRQRRAGRDRGHRHGHARDRHAAAERRPWSAPTARAAARPACSPPTPPRPTAPPTRPRSTCRRRCSADTQVLPNGANGGVFGQTDPDGHRRIDIRHHVDRTTAASLERSPGHRPVSRADTPRRTTFLAGPGRWRRLLSFSAPLARAVCPGASR